MHIAPSDTYIKDTGTAKGNGVFAARPFSSGEVVEVCPVVTFVLAPALPLEIKRIMFNWHYLLTGTLGGLQAIALGYGSMYNHNNPANMRYEADAAQQVLRFVAERDIGKDEELTVNYNTPGGGAVWNDDNWFERMQVKPIIEP